MQVGRMEEDAAREFVTMKLDEVKQILDDIAYETGLVYVVFRQDIADVFGRVGSSLDEVIKVVAPGRLEKAKKANTVAYRANKKELEEKKKQENGGCDEPGIRDGHTEDGR